MSNNEYCPSTTALCFENFKEAALYFEHVLPLNMGRMRGDSEVGDIWSVTLNQSPRQLSHTLWMV